MQSLHSEAASRPRVQTSHAMKHTRSQLESSQPLLLMLAQHVPRYPTAEPRNGRPN